MRGFIGLTKRNLLLFFKDVQTVIFSLLTSIIVFTLYLLFLKGTYIDSIESAMKGLESLVDSADIDMLVNGILLTGIMGSALITVPYNCLTVIVKDRENKIDCDIAATPMRRGQIVLSYFVAAAVSAIVMASVILTIGLLVLKSMGDPCLTGEAVACLYGLIVLGAISSTAFFIILVLFCKTVSASGAFFGILSAASGFVIGAYMPISQFSDTVQTVCNLFPATHITVLIRNYLMSGVLDRIDESIGGIDQGAFAEAMRETFVFKSYMFEEALSKQQSILYVSAAIVICIAVMIVVYSKVYKRK